MRKKQSFITHANLSQKTWERLTNLLINKSNNRLSEQGFECFQSSMNDLTEVENFSI